MQAPPAHPTHHHHGPRQPGWVAPATLAFVAATLVFTGWQVARSCVNVPLWDDFDSFLGFLLNIEDAKTWWHRLGIVTEFHNEHRTFGARIIVWMVNALGAGMNFRVLGMVGASMLMPIAVLVALPVPARRERFAALFFAAAFLFNLQHFENLYWGGASVEHVGVVAVSLAALWLVQRPGHGFFWAALWCGAFAACTLAQGLAVFPAGLFALALARRWRDACMWIAFAFVFCSLWLVGYGDNGAADGLPHSLAALGDVVRFWLGLLGSPLAFGSRAIAPWLGAGVVATGIALTLADAFRGRHTHATFLAFLAGTTALIALGRAGLDPDGFMVSRYRVLSCLVLAILACTLWTAVAHWKHGRALQAALLLLAAAHTIEQGFAHFGWGPEFRERQLRAAVHYADTGTLRGAPTELYYDIPKADRILERSARRRIYDLKAVGREAAEDRR